MSPHHSVGFCPICGGGLCGIRICGIPSESTQGDVKPTQSPVASAAQEAGLPVAANPHGLIVCDECEAIWLDPDVASEHTYPDSENALCPICGKALWGPASRWADQADVEALGWSYAVRPELDCFDEDANGAAN